MTPIEPQVVTDAVIALIAEITEKQVGDHESPPSPSFPYTVVHHIAGGGFGGPAFSAPFADTTYVFQFDAVGEARVQAQALAGRIRTRLLALTVSHAYLYPLVLPEDWAEMEREPDASPAGAERVGTLWQVCDRYRFTLTPK